MTRYRCPRCGDELHAKFTRSHERICVAFGPVRHLNSRELQILDSEGGWAFTIRIRGWLRPRLEVERDPVPTRPDPGRDYYYPGRSGP